MIYDALFAGLVWVKNACIGQNTPHEALLITNGWFRNMKSESQICRSAGDIFLIVDVVVSIMRGRMELECRRLWLRDAIRVSAARPLYLCRAINYWAWTEYSHSEERMPDCETTSTAAEIYLQSSVWLDVRYTIPTGALEPFVPSGNICIFRCEASLLVGLSVFTYVRVSSKNYFNTFIDSVN